MGAAKAALAAGVCLLLAGLSGCGSDDLSVPVPEAEERQQVSAELAEAARAQGICYGWSLGNWQNSSSGSSLGANVPVESDATRCPKYVRVRAEINYQPDSSESEDSASVFVDVYPDQAGGFRIQDGLDRLGLDDQAFIDDPALSISRAALALPLLTAEAGIVDPAPTPSAQPASAPPALAGAGNDFWRDRWGFLAAGAGLLLLAGLFVLAGRRAARLAAEEQARRGTGAGVIQGRTGPGKGGSGSAGRRSGGNRQ